MTLVVYLTPGVLLQEIFDLMADLIGALER